MNDLDNDRGGAESAPALKWVPIRALAARHRPRILAHLLALPPADRYLRFGHVASDAQIGRYVDRIDFDRDEVFGIFNRRLTVVALAHLAFLGDGEAEFGVSVAPHARRRGWGARLFDRAMLEARNRHVGRLIIHALSENGTMLHIARAAGAQVELTGPDAVARLKLPPEDFASHLEAMVEQRAAEFDYTVKRQAQRLDSWLQALAAPRLAPPGTGAPERVDHSDARESEPQPPV